MDKEIKSQHFQEYETALKNYQEKRAVLFLDIIEEIMEDFKKNPHSCQGGKSPGFCSWSISYKFIDDEFAEIVVKEPTPFQDRVHLRVWINKKSNYFTLWCPLYNDSVTDYSPFKKPMIELHHKYFPEMKADYDEDV